MHAPGSETIASILLDAEREAALRPALYTEGRTLTFGDVANGSRRLAAYLRSRGVRAGDRVALLLPNGVAFVTAHYALALLGAVIVPINPLLGAHVVSVLLEKARAVALLGAEAMLSALPDFDRVTGQVSTLVHVIEERGSVRLRQTFPPTAEAEWELDAFRPLDTAHQSRAEDPSLLFFTSGTTGIPKGVLLTERQALLGVDVWASRWSFDESTISLMAAPFFHNVYNPLVLGAHRHRGATVVQTNLSVLAVCAAVERFRVTALMGTPATMRQLVTGRTSRRHDLGSLRQLIFGAAPSPPSLVLALGECFPGVERYNCYGLTEAASALTCLGHADVEGHEATVGRAHPGVRLRIVDSNGEDVPEGQEGEVCAQGPNVISGYFEAPELDVRRFYGSWLRTGDVGYLDDAGYLTLRDRLDDQINVAGEKFYPFQIEEVLLSDPSVGEAAAVGVDDPRRGQVVRAFVVAEQGCELDVEALKRRCADRLPACAVPRRITVLDELPRNPTGKVLRRTLASIDE